MRELRFISDPIGRQRHDPRRRACIVRAGPAVAGSLPHPGRCRASAGARAGTLYHVTLSSASFTRGLKCTAIKCCTLLADITLVGCMLDQLILWLLDNM